MTDEEMLEYQNKNDKINLRYNIVELLMNIQQRSNIISEAETVYNWIIENVGVKVKCNSLQIFPEYFKVTFTPTVKEIDEDQDLKKFGITVTKPAKSINFTIDKGDLTFIPGEEYFISFELVNDSHKTL